MLQRNAMDDTDPRRVIGTYSTPAFRVGDRVTCRMRGKVELLGLTDAPIPWPISRRGKRKALVLYGDLVKADKREASGAICYWWGVCQQTVRRWRLALGIEGQTTGTRRMMRELYRRLGAARLGCKMTDETRRRISEGHRRKWPKREVEPPRESLLPRWTAEEDALVRTLPVQEAVASTGRTLSAVYGRRHLLGLNDGRTMRWQKE